MKCNLSSIRENKGMTQGQLAEKLGVSRQTISTIENNRSFPGIPLLLKILSTFNINLNELYEDYDS